MDVFYLGAEAIVNLLHQQYGLRRLHTFGVKTLGLARFASCDSLAWSMAARHAPPLSGCTHRGHCGNCRRFALRWRAALLDIYRWPPHPPEAATDATAPPGARGANRTFNMGEPRDTDQDPEHRRRPCLRP